MYRRPADLADTRSVIAARPSLTNSRRDTKGTGAGGKLWIVPLFASSSAEDEHKNAPGPASLPPSVIPNSEINDQKVAGTTEEATVSVPPLLASTGFRRKTILIVQPDACEVHALHRRWPGGIGQESVLGLGVSGADRTDARLSGSGAGCKHRAQGWGDVARVRAAAVQSADSLISC
ncbi:hypothetical protein AAFF_G00190930 [Aldrovandia affinis]|uniref:Uncharacterized protein n=1 Tax=Aldrovandia affinis TaxID=143900 RepID=A0AAD7RJ75_9TELE|nr:hypothetical protein AAFF_G00190930 [Aldrovandia affinis]